MPGKLTDEQKAKVLEVANKLIDASIEKLDQTDHWGYRTNKKTNEKYSCITGKHTNLADSQAVWSVHIDTDDIHIHGTANMVTEHNEIQEAHMCKDRGFLAGDKVAEKFGLKQLSEYDNQRKERIHADGIAVLKGMKEFDLQAYFAEMMAKGWVVNPNTPDSKGVIHGYSVGEKLYHNDGSLSSIMMFRASELGHSKDLTPTHLLKTWQKLHANEQEAVTRENSRRPEQPKQRTAPVVPIDDTKSKKEQERDDELYRRLKEEKDRIERESKEQEARRAEQSKPREQSPEEKEARSAVDLETAVDELMDMVDGIAAQIDKSTAAMIGIVAGMALPQVTPSGGGGGGPTGGWRGKRDDDWWRLWKPFFANFRSRGRGRH